MPRSRLVSGFTLIELSIVLVIIGLILGGVVVGRELISFAKLRTLISDKEKFQTATNTFRTKYGGWPGDITNATSYWGADPNCPDIAPGNPPAQATCNGNDSGYIENTDCEPFHYWQQLGNAGLIEGVYTGASLSGCLSSASDVGVNVPPSRFGDNTGFALTSYSVGDTNLVNFVTNYHGHLYVFGKEITTTWPYLPALTPAQAYSVDSKIDDGRPGLGTVLTWKAALHPGCSTTDVASTSQYALGESITCGLLFTRIF